MVGAHNPARGAVVRVHGRARVRAGGEAGFTLIELLIVMIILAILMAVGLPSVRNASQGPSAPATAIAAGIVWRAVQTSRLEAGGVMPTATQMSSQAAGLVDPAGVRRIRPWPETGRGEPIVLTTSAAATPPATGTPNTLVYGVAPGPRPTTGWMVGYGPKGTTVFKRVIFNGAPSLGSTAGASAG